ncbi:MAG: PEP-CTERM sorting domain-containing protein [Woeseiaceae bacterium]
MLRLKTSLAILAVFVGIFGTVGTANALPIDFRDGTVWGGHGAEDFSHGGIRIEANGRALFRDNTDGYGIMGGEWDEIDRQEMLTVWFEASFFDDASNWLTGVLLTDLFPTPDGGPDGEAGWVTLYNAAGGIIEQFYVNALEYVDNGEFYLDFNGSYNPDHVVFTAFVDPLLGYLGSEYSVAGFTTGVPEPGTLALLGVGLLLIGFTRRQRPLARARV